MRTCEVLRSLGFYNINMIEVRQKLFDGRLFSSTALYVYHLSTMIWLRANKIESADLGFPVEEASRDEMKEIDMESSPSTKRARTSTGEAAETVERPEKILYRPRVMPSTAMSVARVIPVMKGHSAFLTFALCPTANMLNILAKKAKAKQDSSSSEVDMPPRATTSSSAAASDDMGR
jgi:hypothetical protein